jgi:hypothetical protein
VKNLPSANDMTALMQGAIATHEMFMAYVQAGFTREEALQLVIAMTTAGMREQQ